MVELIFTVAVALLFVAVVVVFVLDILDVFRRT